MVNCVLWLAARRLLVRLWAWEEHMFPGQALASSIKGQPQLLGACRDRLRLWELQSLQKWNLPQALRRSHRKPPVFGSPGWYPVLFCTEIAFPTWSHRCSCPCLLHEHGSFSSCWNSALLGANAYMKGNSTVHEDWEERCHHIPYWTPIIPSLQVPPLLFYSPPSTNKQMSSSKISQAHTDHGGHPHSAVIYTQIFFRFS